MKKWYEELRLTRRSFEDIGMVFLIREIMQNDITVSRNDLYDVLGPGCEAKLESLAQAGILTIERVSRKDEFGEHPALRLRVITHGDKRREKQRKLMRSIRKKGKK